MKEVKWDEVKAADDVIAAAKEAVNKLVGKPFKEAKEWLDDHKVEYRVLEKDNSYDGQYREDRVNLTVNNECVSVVSLG